MGHDLHFLERLERVDDAQVAFALSLYNDATLVRAMLALAALPDDAERVALALTGTQPSPHAIVARDGSFVTCLAAGMSTGPWPVLSREQLDGLRVRAERDREHAELRAEDGTAFERVVWRLVHHGWRVSREDMQRALAFRPLLLPEYFGAATAWFDKSLAAPRKLRRFVKRKPNRAERKELAAFFNGVLAVGHLNVLVNADDQLLDLLPEEEIARFNPSWIATRVRSFSTAVRGAWSAARLGPRVLRHYKHRYRTIPTLQGAIDSTLAIAAIGLRHRKLRSECIKILSRDTALSDRMVEILHIDTRLAAQREAIDKLFVAVLEKPEAHIEYHKLIGSALATKLETRDPADPGFGAIEDVPDELAWPLGLCVSDEIFTQPEALAHLAGTLPWVANAELLDLYLPESFHERFDMATWTVADSVRLIRAGLELEGTPQPVRVEKTPKRNAPCSCGSGRKYKHCCANATSEPA